MKLFSTLKPFNASKFISLFKTKPQLGDKSKDFHSSNPDFSHLR